MTARPTTSVIICTHTQGSQLPLMLLALPCQTVAPDQIVLADDASTDETARVLADPRNRSPRRSWYGAFVCSRYPFCPALTADGKLDCSPK